jgi:ferritin-like metal-binding protein YciE
MQKRHTTKTTRVGGRPTTTDENDSLRKEIVEWLKDAYGMERGLETALEKQSKNQDLNPEIRERAAIHWEETRGHAEQVRSMLQSLGSDTSLLKTSAGTLAQSAKGIMSAFARDERIKDLLDSYSMEHFEIACYTALAAAAEAAGLPEVIQMCQRILGDERRMAQAILESLPDEVTNYLIETEAAEET